MSDGVFRMSEMEFEKVELPLKVSYDKVLKDTITLKKS